MNRVIRILIKKIALYWCDEECKTISDDEIKIKKDCFSLSQPFENYCLSSSNAVEFKCDENNLAYPLVRFCLRGCNNERGACN